MSGFVFAVLAMLAALVAAWLASWGMNDDDYDDRFRP